MYDRLIDRKGTDTWDTYLGKLFEASYGETAYLDATTLEDSEANDDVNANDLQVPAAGDIEVVVETADGSPLASLTSPPSPTTTSCGCDCATGPRSEAPAPHVVPVVPGFTCSGGVSPSTPRAVLVSVCRLPRADMATPLGDRRRLHDTTTTGRSRPRNPPCGRWTPSLRHWAINARRSPLTRQARSGRHPAVSVTPLTDAPGYPRDRWPQVRPRQPVPWAQ